MDKKDNDEKDVNLNSGNFSETTPSPTPAKRLAALVCVILLAGMDLCTLVLSFFTTPENSYLFRFSLIITIVLPVLAYVLVRLFRR